MLSTARKKILLIYHSHLHQVISVHCLMEMGSLPTHFRRLKEKEINRKPLGKPSLENRSERFME